MEYGTEVGHTQAQNDPESSQSGLRLYFFFSFSAHFFDEMPRLSNDHKISWLGQLFNCSTFPRNDDDVVFQLLCTCSMQNFIFNYKMLYTQMANSHEATGKSSFRQFHVYIMFNKCTKMASFIFPTCIYVRLHSDFILTALKIINSIYEVILMAVPLRSLHRIALHCAIVASFWLALH